MYTLPAVLKQAAHRHADNVATIEDGQPFNYRELNERCTEVAKSLLHLGIQHGDRVAIWAPNDVRWIITACAIQSIGAVLVPINTRLTATEAVGVINTGEITALFTIEEFLGRQFAASLDTADCPTLKHTLLLSGNHGERWLTWQALTAFANHTSEDDVLNAVEGVAPEDAADLLFTSGTTGKPKGIVTTHYQNIRAFSNWADIVGLCQNDRYLLISPFSHNFGYKGGWLACLITGATMVPLPSFNTETVLNHIQQDAITVLTGAPTLFQSLMKNDLHKHYRLDSLRLAVTGSTSIPEHVVYNLLNELNFSTVITGYGLTETGVSTLTRPSDPAEKIAKTVGKPIPGVEIKIFDGDGNCVDTGHHGEICIRGYTVIDGYLNNVADTRAAFDEDGWFHTGDIGFFDTQGYLVISGRKKEMYISGGFNCYPAEIESVISNMPGIHQCAVVSVPDERLGEVGYAFISTSNDSSVDTAKIRDWCSQHIAKYKQPRFIDIVPQIPLNASGKFDKAHLSEIAKATAQST